MLAILIVTVPNVTHFIRAVLYVFCCCFFAVLYMTDLKKAVIKVTSSNSTVPNVTYCDRTVQNTNHSNRAVPNETFPDVTHVNRTVQFKSARSVDMGY